MKKYRSENYYANQKLIISGVPINPKMRVGFDNTEHKKRAAKEVEDWFNKPYIVTDTFPEISYIEYINSDVKNIKSYDEWLKQQAENRAIWLQKYPEGVRYSLRILDGFVSNCYTNIGFYSTFKDVIAAIHELK